MRRFQCVCSYGSAGSLASKTRKLDLRVQRHLTPSRLTDDCIARFSSTTENHHPSAPLAHRANIDGTETPHFPHVARILTRSSMSTTPLLAGVHEYSARYPPDGTYRAAALGTTVHQVRRTADQISVTSSDDVDTYALRHPATTCARSCALAAQAITVDESAVCRPP